MGLKHKKLFDFNYWICKCGYVKSDFMMQHESFNYHCPKCKKFNTFRFIQIDKKQEVDNG